MLFRSLDVTCQQLKDKLVLFLFSTNVPEIVDPAFLRRPGGTTERFGRLTRRSPPAHPLAHRGDPGCATAGGSRFPGGFWG